MKEICTSCRNKNMNHWEGVFFGFVMGLTLGLSILFSIIGGQL